MMMMMMINDDFIILVSIFFQVMRTLENWLWFAVTLSPKTRHKPSALCHRRDLAHAQCHQGQLARASWQHPCGCRPRHGGSSHFVQPAKRTMYESRKGTKIGNFRFKNPIYSWSTVLQHISNPSTLQTNFAFPNHVLFSLIYWKHEKQ